MINIFSNHIENHHNTASREESVISSYLNTNEFKNKEDWEKLWFLIYIIWNISDERLKSKLWEFLKYLEIKNPKLIKQSEGNHIFNVENMSQQNEEWEKIFDEILSQLGLSYEIIHNTLSKIENHKQSIIDKIRIFKLFKYVLWYDDVGLQNSTIWNAIQEIKFVALRWTHWDETWALKWSKTLEWKVTTYLVNPEAVEMWTRESDEDINRNTTPWSISDTRKKELINKVSQEQWHKYLLDFHNCNGSAKLWCVDEYSIKHELIAKSLWLDALLIFDKELSNWTVIDALQKQTNADGMIIEIWKDIDEAWKTTLQVAQSLLEVNKEFSLVKEWFWSKNDKLTIDDLSQVLGVKTNNQIPIITISIYKDKQWNDITEKEKIDPSIPSHCIQFRQWINKYVIIKNKDGSYPSKETLDRTLFQM